MLRILELTRSRILCVPKNFRRNGLEHIDIYDANLRHLGTESSATAHRQGCWHKTYHLWVVSSRNGGSVLYQRRSNEMESFPNLLDVSAAGHLLAGESMADGIREAEEELGLDLSWNTIHDLGYRIEVADQVNLQKNREFQGVHMTRIENDLSEFSPQTAEVSGLYWIPISSGIELFSGARKKIEGTGKLYCTKDKAWKDDQCEFQKTCFIPRIQNYYITAHIMAERLLAKRLPLSIS